MIFLCRNVLHKELDLPTRLITAKRSTHLPTVLTPIEVHNVLQYVEDTAGLITKLLYGNGMRLQECLRSRPYILTMCKAGDIIYLPVGKGANNLMNTKQKILDVSLQLFMQLGFENTYMDDVAQKAGVTKPAIYYYFKDKQALFEATAAQFLDQMAQMMSPEGEKIPPLEGLLDVIFSSLPEWLGRYQKMSGIDDRTSLLRVQVFIYDAMTRIPDFRSAFATLYRNSAQLLQRACEEATRRGEIRPAIDLATVSILINSMIEGLLLMAMVDPQINLEEVGREGAETLWRMLKV